MCSVAKQEKRNTGTPSREPSSRHCQHSGTNVSWSRGDLFILSPRLDETRNVPSRFGARSSENRNCTESSFSLVHRRCIRLRGTGSRTKLQTGAYRESTNAFRGSSQRAELGTAVEKSASPRVERSEADARPYNRIKSGSSSRLGPSIKKHTAEEASKFETKERFISQ